MQKPVDTTQRINQLLLRASKPLNTLEERKGVCGGWGKGGGGGVGGGVRSWDKLLMENEEVGSWMNQLEREESQEGETKARGIRGK